MLEPTNPLPDDKGAPNFAMPLPRPAATLTLTDKTAVDPIARRELMAILNAGAGQIYREFLPQFLNSLAPIDRALYQAAQKIPYNPKDWWRDPHDIIVVRSMALILANEFTADGKNLPQFLITCAVLHDRGYGVMTAVETQRLNQYLKNEGAHWENQDTRILHSRLSRLYAAYKLYGHDFASTEISGYEPYFELIKECDIPIPSNQISAEIIENRDLILDIIEKHDHALIGRYQEIPAFGRHHFDADSLYSISVSSFVKDYLSYANEPRKLKLACDAGLCGDGEFRPATLLIGRLARYYDSVDQLPNGWNLEKYPLNSAGLILGESDKCYQPHSKMAKALTDRAFLILANACDQLDQLVSAEDFQVWYKSQLLEDYRALFPN